MTQMISESFFETVDAVGEPPAQIRAGLVFVPCALCHAPLDLSVLSDTGRPRLCESHDLVFVGLPLQ